MNSRFWRELWLMGSPLMVAGLLANCQGTSKPAVPVSVKQAVTEPAKVASPVTAPENATFAAWLEAARQDAVKRGIKPGIVAAALNEIAPIPRVIELDNRQPEFSNTFTRYLSGAISARRVADGRAMMEKHAKLLADLEHEYGIPGRFLVAFWGMESDYGRDSGGFPVVNALATLAFDGRRPAFREEVFNALTILDRGHVSLEKMKGSWAGAMGQTQFMPSTFLKHAVDEDHNGRIDIWDNVPDALGSTANFLKDMGWDRARTWGREVRLPAQFDVALASLDVEATETVKPLAEWAALGIRRTDGEPLPAQKVKASLILPAGAKGPAFLVYDNYRTILKYNRSTYYAVAVGYLADRLSGSGPISGVSEGEPLRRDEVTALQEGLAALGLYKNVDGVLGNATRQAIRVFQRANGLVADGYADRAIIAAIKAKAGGA